MLLFDFMIIVLTVVDLATTQDLQEDDVSFTISPDLVKLGPNQEKFAYKIDCRTVGSFSKVYSIRIDNAWGSTLMLTDADNMTYPTGWFEDADILTDIGSEESSAYLTATFTQANVTVHFGSFSCSINGTRTNATSPSYITTTAVLRQIGIPAIQTTRKGSDLEVTCSSSAACLSWSSVEFFKDGLSMDKKTINTSDSSCNHISKTFTSSYDIKVAEIGEVLKFSCSVTYRFDNNTETALTSATRDVSVEKKYGQPCNSSDICLGTETCLNISCSLICSCGSSFFYNDVTCEKKKNYGETCSDDDQCSTWLSECDKSSDKCACRNGDVYDSTSNSCTNIVRCPGQSNYIHFPEERKCYKIAHNTDNSTSDWKRFCSETSARPLHLTETLRTHMVNRLWNLGYYTSNLYLEASLTDRLEIILSTNYSATSTGWYWPDGSILSLGRTISYPQDWKKEAVSNTSCLYMVYDGVDSTYEATLQCDYASSFKGCLIELPKAYCKAGVDARNNTWNFTEGGTILNKTCPEGYRGLITRECGINGNYRPAVYNCTLAKFDDIEEQLKNGTVNTTDVLDQVRDVTKNNSDNLYLGDLNKVTDLLDKVVNASANTAITTEAVESFLDTVNVLVDNEKAGKEWESSVEKEGKGVEKVMEVTENLAKKAQQVLDSANKTNVVVSKPNLDLILGKLDKDLSKKTTNLFSLPPEEPKQGENKTTPSSTSPPVSLNSKAIEGTNVESFSIVLYKNLSKSLPKTLEGSEQDNKTEISSQVISVQLLPAPPEVLEPNIEFDFSAFEDVSTANKHCSFWKTTVSGPGRWSTEGCRVITSDDRTVKCGCNHLTNFALLISPYVLSGEQGEILSIISIVGISISAAAIVITIFLHAVYWKALKSDKNIVTMCLCVTLLIGNMIFISAVTNIEDLAGCTAVSVILHYIFLVVFFLMFAEGINVFIAIVFVFHKKSHLWQLLAGAFGLPVVIVGIAMGATKLEGYGTHGSCWLSRDNGLFWAFAGPAVLIIALNYVIIVVLFRTMYHTTSFVDKTNVEKAKMTAMALAVISPVTGITWIIGIFSIDENTAWLQYVFCIFNSLQGVLIFIFHCVRNKQLHQAMRARRKRKESLQDFESSGISISGISGAIRKGFAGIMSFKKGGYDFMSMDKLGSESGVSSHRTEQSEISKSETSVVPEKKLEVVQIEQRSSWQGKEKGSKVSLTILAKGSEASLTKLGKEPLIGADEQEMENEEKGASEKAVQDDTKDERPSSQQVKADGQSKESSAAKDPGLQVAENFGKEEDKSIEKRNEAKL